MPVWTRVRPSDRPAATRTEGLIYARERVSRSSAHPGASLRDDSQRWLAALRGPAAARAQAQSDLHALLLRGANFELSRRRAWLTHIAYGELDDLAMQAADDAMVAILAKLDTFRGRSRFTTWAYKFVLLEAGVKARRRAWQGREVELTDDAWRAAADTGLSAHQVLEETETLRAVSDALQTSLTEHQRVVFVALALNGVPIDVLAERLHTTRGALYKALHDARRKLRAALPDAGLPHEATTAKAGGREH
jgi:RNA polymerase sigma-70 factor, ECF subfamily